MDLIDELQIIVDKHGICGVCRAALEEYESDRLDCGHYACNSCAYSLQDRTYCSKCEPGSKE